MGYDMTSWRVTVMTVSSSCYRDGQVTILSAKTSRDANMIGYSVPRNEVPSVYLLLYIAY